MVALTPHDQSRLRIDLVKSRMRSDMSKMTLAERKAYWLAYWLRWIEGPDKKPATKET